MTVLSTFSKIMGFEGLQPRYAENILETIGQTLLVKLKRVTAEASAGTLATKVEFFTRVAPSRTASGAT